MPREITHTHTHTTTAFYAAATGNDRAPGCSPSDLNAALGDSQKSAYGIPRNPMDSYGDIRRSVIAPRFLRQRFVGVSITTKAR